MAEFNQQYNHIYSNDINIFPLSKHRENNRNNNLFYEQNIANIINQIIDINLSGFIIDAPEVINKNNVNNTVPDSIVKLNLKGYYIEINNISKYVTEDKPLFIGVVLSNKQENQPQEIDGQDDDNLFTGVILNNSPIPDTYPSIQLYDENGNVCKENFARFNVNSLNITGIDGKHQ